MVSSSVRPVSTRVVIVFSSSDSVAHDWMSLDSGTFSGSQKLVVSRSQTSRYLGSSIWFQLIAWIGLMRLWVRVVGMSGLGAGGTLSFVNVRSDGAGDAVVNLGTDRCGRTEA